jgi:DNA repair protein RecO (recombination protein O)
MRTYTAEALVLRTYRYGEADRIVVFLTEDRGKRRGVAKNATVSRRRFGAALEPFTRGRVTYVERETRDLVRLDRIDLRQSPLGVVAGAEGDPAHRLGHAGYFAELLDEWAPEAAPNDRLYRLGAGVGDALARGGSVEALARYFEYWLLRLEGLYPSLTGCARCGRQEMPEGAVLLPGELTVVCGDCSHQPARLSPEALAFLRAAGRHSPVEAATSGASRAALREIEQAHSRLIAMHLEKELRSARVVRELGARS